MIFYFAGHGAAGVSLIKRTVLPGGNITLYCDLDSDVGDVEWHKKYIGVNCPVLSMSERFAPPRFSVTQNSSTKSFDLSIQNVSDDDLGLYYCTGIKKAVEMTGMTFKVFFQAPLPVSLPSCPPPPNHEQCWILLASLCPICAFLGIISSTCVCCFIREKESMNIRVNLTIMATDDNTTTVVYKNMD